MRLLLLCVLCLGCEAIETNVKSNDAIETNVSRPGCDAGGCEDGGAKDADQANVACDADDDCPGTSVCSARGFCQPRTASN